MEIINNKLNGKIKTTICLLSDIHFYHKYNKKTFDKIINNIKVHKPNYICIAGDIIDNPVIINTPIINKLYDFIKELSMITKVIISIGNHDIADKQRYCYNKEFFNKLNSFNNVKLLDNEIYIDNNICFIGYTQSFSTIFKEVGEEEIIIDEVNNLLKKINNKNYNILLAHNPLYILKDEVYTKLNNFNKVNLMLSGHTHGGLTPSFIKGNIGFVSPLKAFFIDNARGYLKKGNTDIIISTGIVKLSYSAGLLHPFNCLFPTSINYIDIEGD